MRFLIWILEFGFWIFCFWSLDFGVWRFEFGILDLGTGVGGRSSSGGGGGGGAPTVWLSSASIWGAKSTHSSERS